MHQLTPTTSTLEPAIAHIADTATELSRGAGRPVEEEEGSVSAEEWSEKIRAKQTVIWALSCPKRMRRLIEQGRQDEARAEYGDVLRLLDMWKDVPGARELREKCEGVMKGLD